MVKSKSGRRRTRKAPDVRKKEVLDAAVSAFAQKGYGGTDLQVVADTLGIAKGTIYLYFSSKRELFLAAVDHAVGLLMEAVETAVEAASGPLERVEAMVRAYLQFFDHNKTLAEVLVREHGEFTKRAKKTYARSLATNIGRLKEILREGIASGVFRPVDTDLTTESLANLVHGTIYTRVLGKGSGRAADIADNMIDLFFNGILSETKRKKSRGRSG